MKPTSDSLSQFKLIIKMHKSTWRKAGRPITSETGSILQRLTKIVFSALHALRPTFQRGWLETLRQAKIYVTEALNGPPVTLDGQDGIIRRVRTINRYMNTQGFLLRLLTSQNVIPN